MSDIDIFILEDRGLGCDNLSCIAASVTRGNSEETVRFSASAETRYFIVYDSPDDSFYGGDCEQWNEYFEGYLDFTFPNPFNGYPDCHGVWFYQTGMIYEPSE